MPKKWIVLFALGLALGLWIGLNPQAREKAATGWENTKTFFVTMKIQVSAATQDWVTQLKSNVRSGARQISLAWRQTSTVFVSLWDSVRHIWLTLRTGVS